MREFIKIVLQLINIISFGATLFFATIGILTEFVNSSTFEKILSALKIPLNYNNFLLAGYISVAAMIITFFLLCKFFWK